MSTTKTWITGLTWHACKYKVQKLHQRHILIIDKQYINWSRMRSHLPVGWSLVELILPEVKTVELRQSQNGVVRNIPHTVLLHVKRGERGHPEQALGNWTEQVVVQVQVDQTLEPAKVFRQIVQLVLSERQPLQLAQQAQFCGDDGQIVVAHAEFGQAGQLAKLGGKRGYLAANQPQVRQESQVTDLCRDDAQWVEAGGQGSAHTQSSRCETDKSGSWFLLGCLQVVLN